MSDKRALPVEPLLTGEQLERMVGLGPCELVDGRIVPMTPTSGEHGFIEGNLYARRSRTTGFLDVAPELVVEILSPNDPAGDLAQKIREYLSAGVAMVWVVDAAAQRVLAYRGPTEVREFGPDDTLPGDEILPGFAVTVATLFEE